MKKGERASSALFHSLHKWDSLPKCGKVGPFFADFVLHGLMVGKGFRNLGGVLIG